MQKENNVMRELLEVQKKCLDILKVIDSICRKNNIMYSLTAGSVIGYHLYSGFIPWDDDIDLMMTRENYERFLEVCLEELPKNYSIHNFENGEDKGFLFSKVVDECTTVVEYDKFSGEKIGGVFVDISVFDKYPKDIKQRKIYIMLSRIVQYTRKKECDWKLGRGIKEDIRRIILNIIYYTLRPFDNIIYRFIKGIYMRNLTGAYDYAELMFGLKNAYDSEMFKEYIDVFFGGIKCMLVKDYMAYLEARYGRREFYKTPQKEDVPHHYIYVDCNKAYREYINEKGKEV